MLRIKAQRILLNMITESLMSNKGDFKNSVQNMVYNLSEGSKDEQERIFEALNNRYYNAVLTDIITKMRMFTPEISSRLDNVLKNSTLSGYNDIDVVENITADKVYALCFFALTGKQASIKGRLSAKQLQSFAIQDVMRQIIVEAS